MNETSKCKQLNCCLISKALVEKHSKTKQEKKQKTKQEKNKKQNNKKTRLIFFCQSNSDSDPMSHRNTEMKGWSIKNAFVFRSTILCFVFVNAEIMKSARSSALEPDIAQEGTWCKQVTSSQISLAC